MTQEATKLSSIYKPYRVPSEQMNEIVAAFTLNRRPWPAFGADKIEVMARWYGVVPQNALYSAFDDDSEELIFTLPLDENPYEPPRSWWAQWWHNRLVRWHFRRQIPR